MLISRVELNSCLVIVAFLPLSINMPFLIVDYLTSQFAVFLIQLEPKTVWLKQEFRRRCYFPDQNGLFNLDADIRDSVLGLSVEGIPTCINQTSPSTSVLYATPATNPSHSNQPYYKPIWSKSKDAIFNVKVVKANMTKLLNGKVEFERLEQTHTM